MPESEIYNELTEVFRSVFDDDTIVIGPQTTAADIVGWDSAIHLQLILATEMHFNIRFRTAEFELLRNVGDFVALIQGKLKKR
jgi:acyl carrier protein